MSGLHAPISSPIAARNSARDNETHKQSSSDPLRPVADPTRPISMDGWIFGWMDQRDCQTESADGIAPASASLGKFQVQVEAALIQRIH